MNLEFENPEIGELEEVEKEFLEDLRDQPVLGRPEYSVDLQLGAGKSRIRGSSTEVIMPYLDDAEVVVSLRAVSQEDYNELKEDKKRELSKIAQEVSQQDFSHPLSYQTEVYNQIGDFIYSNHSFNAEINGLQENFARLRSIEENIGASTDMTVEAAAIKAISQGETVEEVYSRADDSLTANLYIRYLGEGKDIPGRIELDSGMPEVKGFTEDKVAQEQVRGNIREIYEKITRS